MTSDAPSAVKMAVLCSGISGLHLLTAVVGPLSAPHINEYSPPATYPLFFMSLVYCSAHFAGLTLAVLAAGGEQPAHDHRLPLSSSQPLLQTRGQSLGP